MYVYIYIHIHIYIYIYIHIYIDIPAVTPHLCSCVRPSGLLDLALRGFAQASIKGPRDHINRRISRSGSKVQWNGSPADVDLRVPKGPNTNIIYTSSRTLVVGLGQTANVFSCHAGVIRTA